MDQEEFDRIKEAEAERAAQEGAQQQAQQDRLQVERSAQANAQQQAQQRFNDYQVWQNVPNGLSSGISSGQILPNIAVDRAFRAQALSMAIEHHKNCGHGDVAETAAKFFAFLKGDANV